MVLHGPGILFEKHAINLADSMCVYIFNFQDLFVI